jgi:hypothetical protein
MARPRKLDPDAEQVAVYLNPTEKLVMDVIAGRRKKRGEARTSQSEVVVDGLWKILTEAEGVPRAKIEELLAVTRNDTTKADNLEQFPRKDRP